MRSVHAHHVLVQARSGRGCRILENVKVYKTCLTKDEYCTGYISDEQATNDVPRTLIATEDEENFKRYVRQHYEGVHYNSSRI